MKTSDRIRILIAEDEPAILRYIKNVIGQEINDYEVIGTAFNGKEAFHMIKEKKPDVVITDIMMPMLTGLELIEECRENEINSNFIILTGYEKFEYARQAMSLGVTNYLLKPIDSMELKTCLNEIRSRIFSDRRQQCLTWLRYTYMDNGKCKSMGLMKDKKIYLLSTFFGSIGNNLYCTFHKSIDIINLISFDFVNEIERLYDVQIYHFPGNYQNEYVFVAVADKDKNINIERIGQSIHGSLVNNKISVTLCSSQEIREAKSMEEVIRNIYLSVVTNLKFGQNTLLNTNMNITQDITVSDFVHKKVENINPMLHQEEVRRIIDEIIDYWEEIEATQFSIQMDLRYILQYSLQSSTVIPEQISDVNDLIYFSYDYNDLRSAIIYEIDKIFNYTDGRQMKGNRKKALSEEVKQYLDKHFVEQITFKEFHDKFGYNEKYITSLFKEQYGISPSRYVLERRIELAKKLLVQKPDILLKDISEIVGYSDSLYFSRVFKTSVGVSPSAYVKHNNQGDKE